MLIWFLRYMQIVLFSILNIYSSHDFKFWDENILISKETKKVTVKLGYCQTNTGSYIILYHIHFS